jgi:hypothetical protein
MGWNGSGTFSRTNGDNTGSTTWQQDKSDGDKITASRHDTHDQDLADGINACIAKNGENAMTSDLDFGNNGATNMATINTIAVPTETDYTPTFSSSIASSISYTTQVGRYVTIGDMVIGYFHVAATLTGIDTSSPQPLLIVRAPLNPYGSFSGAVNITEYAGLSINPTGASALNTSNSFYIQKDTGSSTDEADTLDITGSTLEVKGTFIYRRA